MSVINAYRDLTRNSASASVEQITAKKIGNINYALDGISYVHDFVLIGSDSVESGSTATTINATSHTAISGDILFFTSGNVINQSAYVESVTANTIKLQVLLTLAPDAGATFNIYRPRPSQLTELLQSIDGKITQVNTDNTTSIAKQAEVDLNSIEGVYDNVTTTRSQTNINTAGYRHYTFCWSMLYTGTASSATIDFEISARSANTNKSYVLQNKFLRYEDQGFTALQNMAIQGDVHGASLMDIGVTASNTTATQTFTISDAVLLLGS